VALLFQNARFEAEKDAKCNTLFIFVPNSPKLPPRRISLSFKAISDTRQVRVLASGAGKEDALKRPVNAEGYRSEGETGTGDKESQDDKNICGHSLPRVVTNWLLMFAFE
jgi:hypothetical protein